MAFATGKYAKFISDRRGQSFPYKERIREWNGSIVHISEYEAKHPQLEPVRHVADAQALKDARPNVVDDMTPFTVFTSTGKDIIPSSIENLSTLNSSIGTVTIDTSVVVASTFDSTSVTLDGTTKTFDEG